jgi:hypothetical protein
MPSFIGNTGSFVKRTVTEQIGKPPHYEDIWVGTSASMQSMQNSYANFGWSAKLEAGNPYTLTSTIDAALNGDNSPNTSSTATGSASAIQTNWSFHFDTAQKDLLHVGIAGLYNGNGSWIGDINEQDKVALDYYISNPPTHIIGDIAYPTTMSWSGPSSSFSSDSTSIAAAQVVWTLAKNGQKTVGITVPILRLTKIVPFGYDLSPYTNNINRVWSALSLYNYYGIPNSFYNVMWQPSDPASGTVQTDAGVNIPLIYGWFQNPPSIDQNGAVVTIQLDFTYGLYYQTLVGTRL